MSTHSVPFIHMKPCCRPAAVRTRPIVEMPTVISQNDQLPSLKDQNSRPHSLARRRPAADRPDDEGAEHRQVRVRDDEIGEVGRLLNRPQGLGRALEAAEQVHDGAHDQELGRQVGAEVCQRPLIVPKKFTTTVHTGMISSIEVMIARVSAQSAIGL